MIINQINGNTQAEITSLDPRNLPPGDVLIEVAYSSLNYKDGLIVSGRGNLVRDFPMVPGIDLVGTVLETSGASSQFQPGDAVVLTGWGIGERHWGGYAELARVKSEWLVPLPQGLTMQQAMSIGTAGFTAMMAVMALEAHGCQPDQGDVVVTGAAGGVGSLAVAILAHLGYQVVASTGRQNLTDYLLELGAREVIDRNVLAAPSKQALESSRWAGAIDSVGGDTLATLLRTMKYGGTVASCGLAGGSHLNTTVIPFLLRGITLAGIDSVMCPPEKRGQIWDRVAKDLPHQTLDQVTKVVALSEVPSLSEQILAGQVQGRVVVDVRLS